MSTTAQSIQGKPRRESLIGRTLHDGEYAIERILGHGGMGNVYLARHTSLKIPLAIKQARADQPLPESVIAELDYTLHSSDIARRSPYEGAGGDFPTSGGVHTDRFLREALLLARLQHPAIPTLYDYFFEDGSWYLVMDYIPGSTLNSYLHRHAPLAPLEALNYAMQICDVLDYLHRQSPPIVFRDLKPSNIILTPDGALMLVDFGIARYFKEGQINDTADFGSPGYAPPEQYQGEGQTDGRSDLFSLGIILDEMLSARGSRSPSSTSSPFQHSSVHGSAALSGLITLATRAEPMFRFQSAHTFYQALERVYSVEERLAYERYIFQRESGQTQDDTEARPDQDEEALDTPQNIPPTPTTAIETFIPLPPRSSEQRQEIRDALQRARQERLEQEHLVLVDESLKRRSLTSLSQAALRQVKEPEPPPPPPSNVEASPRPVGRFKRILRALFFLALLLVVTMTSLLAVRFAPRVMPATTIKQAQASPGGAKPPARSWQALPALPALEADNTAVYVRVQGRAYIYMSGGYHGPQARPRYDHMLYRYDIAAARWEQLTPPFPGMLNNAAVSDEDGRIFFTAGYSTDLYSVPSLLYMYDPASGKMSKIVPPASIHIGFDGSMIADQRGHLYLTQGFMQAGDPQAQAGTGWYRYDIATGLWHRLAPLPLGLGFTMLALDSNGNIFLLGGSEDEAQIHQVNTVYSYNSKLNVWQRVQAALPQVLSGAAGCSVAPDQMVVIGGYNADQHAVLARSWLVDLRTWRWEELAPLPAGGATLGAAVCDGRGHVFLVRGASNLTQPTRDFWLLTIKGG